MRLGIALALLTVSTAARAELPTIDTGVRWIQTCASQQLVFRTPSDGWLFSACGDVYRTRNGGHNWRRVDGKTPPLSLLPSARMSSRDMAWLSPLVGFIVAGDGRMVRTTDGGQTWTASTIPVDYVYRVTRRGGSTWVCDSRGTILRSDDEGTSWRRLGSPMSSGCQSLSFVDRDHGWITGSLSDAKLWETSDGGTTWSELPLPESGLQNPRVIRLTRTAGWLFGYGKSEEAFVTRDGGQHWAQLSQPNDTKHAYRSRVRIDGVDHTFTTPLPVTTMDELLKTAPADAHLALTALDEHNSVRLEKGEITFYRDGARVSSNVVLSEPSGASERVRGLLTNMKGKTIGAWSEGRIYGTEDEGSHWYVVADAPEQPLDGVIMLNDSRALARARSGTLYASLGWLGRWGATTEPFDAWEWARRVPGATPVASPMQCLSTAADATVSIHFVEQGCFHHRKSSFELKVRNTISSVGLELPAEHQATGATSQRTLALSDARSILGEIVKIVERGDGAPQCGSTSSLLAAVKWGCDGVEHEARFDAPSCGGGDTATMSGFGRYEPMRADGLFALARRLASPQTH